MKLPMIVAGGCVGLGIGFVLAHVEPAVTVSPQVPASIRISPGRRNLPDDASNPESSAIKRIAVLAGTDPGDALARADAETNSAFRLTLLAAAGKRIAHDHPRLAFSLSSDLLDHEARRVYLEAVARVLSAKDPVWANSLAETLPEGPLRDAMQQVVAIEWSQTDPAMAACFLAERMSGGEAQDQAALTVATRWLHSDPTAVKRWRNFLPDSDLKERISNAILSFDSESAD